MEQQVVPGFVVWRVSENLYKLLKVREGEAVDDCPEAYCACDR